MLKRTLVANRGEIACRILRACREAGIEGVAIYAENDSGTLFTELADIAVQLEGEGLAETYLNQQQILQIALDTGCDSIHRDSDSCLSVRISHKQSWIQV